MLIAFLLIPVDDLNAPFQGDAKAQNVGRTSSVQI
jgi:hypothetical protein